MPMSCFSSTGQLQFDCYGAAAATAGEARLPSPPDEIVGPRRTAGIVGRCRRHVPVAVALIVLSLSVLLAAGILLR